MQYLGFVGFRDVLGVGAGISAKSLFVSLQALGH